MQLIRDDDDDDHDHDHDDNEVTTILPTTLVVLWLKTKKSALSGETERKQYNSGALPGIQVYRAKLAAGWVAIKSTKPLGNKH